MTLPTTSKELAEYLGGGWKVWTPEPWPEYLGDLGSLPGDEREGATKDGWDIFIEYFETDGIHYQGELSRVRHTGYHRTPEEALRDMERSREITIEKTQRELTRLQAITPLAELRDLK